MLVRLLFLFTKGIIYIEQQKTVVSTKFDIAMKFVMVTISSIEFWKNFLVTGIIVVVKWILRCLQLGKLVKMIGLRS